METSPEQLTPPDPPRVRRRLVQSTLFPSKPSLDHGGEKEAEEGDECCGSQSKRKKRERKPRASKKVAVENQVTPNGRVDNKDSSAKPNLLADPSEGQYPQADQPCIGSQEENNGTCSPLESTPVLEDMKSPRKKRLASSTPRKKQLQTTPRKNGRNGTCPQQMLDCGAQNGNAVQIPDLRLEAKMKAEENARIFAGRKVHPFFSSCKVSKKNQVVDVDSWCPSETKNRSTNLGPIHVFEKVQDDLEPIEWGNYLFSERSFTVSDYGGQCECSPFSEKSVGSLQFDDFVSPSPSGFSLPPVGVSQPDHVSLDRSGFEQEHRPEFLPVLFADKPPVNCVPIKDVAKNCDESGKEKNDFICGDPDSLSNSEPEWEDRFVHKRMMTYYQGTATHPENSLWTNKFFPEKAIEVCGNCESVNFLSEWLRLWSEKGFCSSKEFAAGEEALLQGDDSNCYGSDCDSENRDEANGLKNVLLVSGQVGSGKSAAVYACAKEQGFHVIEVNASDWRTRALVMQRFAGGMESYWVQRTVETQVDSEKCFPASFAAMFSNKSVKASDQELIEVIPLSDDNDLQSFSGTSGKFVCESNKVASDRSESKPLILFEDVDALLSEDHGLIATIQKLAETAKRPIILTSNSSNLILPNNMDRHELCFMKPSVKELFSHTKMVCASEKVDVQPRLVERFINFFQGDIRKTIINLQFWCQGRKCRKDTDRKGPKKYSPLFYDTEAGHRVLPKILPWGYPSELSKVVEKEICRSLFAEESLKLMMIIKKKEENGNEIQYSPNWREHNENEIQYSPNWRTPETGSIKAKKEAILRRHFSAQNGNEFCSPCSNSTGSPVAFMRRNVRRKLDTVLSSDSEGEEGTNHRISIPVDDPLGINSNDDILFQVENAPPSHDAATKLCLGPVSEQLVTFNNEISEESFNLLPEPLLNGISEGGLNNKLPLSGVNLLESNYNDKKLYEADTAARIYAGTELGSTAPSYCAVSDTCSTPIYEQVVISKEGISDKSCNPKFDLNENFLFSGASLVENNHNDGVLFQADSSVPSYCEATEICSNLAPGQLVSWKEVTCEKSFNPLPDPLLNGMDMSCAPELSFVPETEVNGGIFSTDNELMQPVESNYRSIPKVERSPQVVKFFGVDIVTTHEEVGDSNHKEVEGGDRGYQVMDECSRMEFSGRVNFEDKPQPYVLTESVEGMWKRIRNCRLDLREYVTPQEQDASVIMKLAYEMSNLISETDILLRDCQPLITDILEPSMTPPEKSHSFSWYDDHMSMTSTIAQHGICFYTKEIVAVRPDNSSVEIADLAGEMLSSSTNTMSFGNLVSQEMEMKSSEMAPPKSLFSKKSDSDPNLCSVIQSIVPARSYLATRGYSLYEYISALGKISRSEISRLSESNDKSRLRRVRVARNYLSTGAMMLLPEDISLLDQYSSYKKDH